jgi:hypothetical protein
MLGVAPRCAVNEARPSLGREAGGRSPSIIVLLRPLREHAHPLPDTAAQEFRV